MPKLSIIIRSYNEEQHIGRLLHGIEMQGLPAHEVILVDSGSTDSTVPIAEKYGVRVVHIPKAEFSFGRALNRGCAVATGDILVFASAHVYPLRRDWLEHLAAPFADPEIVLCYGRQTGNDVTRFSEHQVFKSWFPAQSIARQSHTFCNNANCAIRRSWWERHRYDETLTGLEDLAWAKAARAAGGQIAYSAEAVIAHVHEESWSRIRNRYRREALALRQIEPGIRFSWLDFLTLTTQNTATDLREALRQRVLARKALEILLFRVNQFFGTWQGHNQSGDIDAALRNRFYYPAQSERQSPQNSEHDIDYRASSAPNQKPEAPDHKEWGNVAQSR
jgi:glycosyltransferase involved in cell wall biosynthesis